MASKGAGRATIEELAAATPATRERTIDFLRALSIGCVVTGHWLMAAVSFREGSFSGQNALDVVPGLWPLTWVLQVMPIFFFVGGFSNFASWRSVREKGGSYGTYMGGRLRRLIPPTMALAAVWLVLAAALYLGGLNRPLTEQIGLLMGRPLWFIGIYLLVVALAPPMIALHRRYGIRVPLVLATVTLAVDILVRGAGIDAAGYVNFAAVWLFAHQIGFFYADGSLPRLRRGIHGGMMLAGLAAMIGLTALGPYAKSMVGAGAERSNQDPPSFVLLALTMWLVGVVMIARPRLAAWLKRPRVWRRVVAVNAIIMTTFLWHQTALVAGSASFLPLGFPQPEIGTLAWWLLRPLWLVGLALPLTGLVLLLGRFERPRAGERGTPSPPVVAVGIVALTLGILGFAVAGFAPTASGDLMGIPVTPWTSALAAVLGYRMTSGRRRRSTCA